MISDDFFEQITEHFDANLPFVAYRKPDDATMKALLQMSNDVFTVSDFAESGFVMAPFEDINDAVLIPLETSKFISTDAVMSNRDETAHNSVEISASSGMMKQNHIQLVQKGIDAINDAQFDKVVLSRQEAVLMTESNPIAILKRLLQTYPTAFVYCWYHPKIGLWLGATPETLLKVENNRFMTMALAGTQEYKNTLEVVWDKKEQDEQQFVTDYIVDSLQSSVSSIQVSETKTVKAGNLLHLKTTISGLLKDLNLKTVIGKLHPTPAVCGVPRNASKAFILKEESYNREFYTGFLGELNFKEKTTRNTNRRNVENNAYATVKTVTNLYVNLRCMQWQNNKLLLYLGGGITKDSNPEAEWEETVSKAKVMKKVLQ